MEKKNFLFGVVALAGAALFGNPADLTLNLTVTNNNPVIKIKNTAGTSTITEHTFSSQEYPVSADLTFSYKVAVEDKGSFNSYRVDIGTTSDTFQFIDGTKSIAFTVTSGTSSFVYTGSTAPTLIATTNAETITKDVTITVPATAINGVVDHTFNGQAVIRHTMVSAS